MEDDNKLRTIYKITCLTNGKVYVGATSMSIKARLGCHWRSRNRSGFENQIYEDMRSFRREDFVIETIESGLSSDESALREDYWIKKLSNDGYSLYNKNSGGAAIQLSREQEEEIIQLYKEGLSTREVAKVVGRGKETIWQTLKHNGVEMHDAWYSKSVLCVETGIIYKSACEAARQLGLHNSCVSRCCLGELKSTGGFHFEYVTTES